MDVEEDEEEKVSEDSEYLPANVHDKEMAQQRNVNTRSQNN